MITFGNFTEGKNNYKIFWWKRETDPALFQAFLQLRKVFAAFRFFQLWDQCPTAHKSRESRIPSPLRDHALKNQSSIYKIKYNYIYQLIEFYQHKPFWGVSSEHGRSIWAWIFDGCTKRNTCAAPKIILEPVLSNCRPSSRRPFTKVWAPADDEIYTSSRLS